MEGKLYRCVLTHILARDKDIKYGKNYFLYDSASGIVIDISDEIRTQPARLRLDDHFEYWPKDSSYIKDLVEGKTKIEPKVDELHSGLAVKFESEELSGDYSQLREAMKSLNDAYQQFASQSQSFNKLCLEAKLLQPVNQDTPEFSE